MLSSRAPTATRWRVKRVSTRLASGKQAWVYVDIRFAPPASVAFVGLGNMGRAMARNLLASGIPLMVWNRTASKGDDLVADGALRAETLADAGPAEVVMTMVSDDGALKEALFEGGLLDALRPGSIHVSMSTISVALAEQLSKEHARRGLALVCAPVMGRPDAAAAAKLFILAAGEEAALERCQPLFDAIGQRTFRFGSQPSAASVVKLSVNFLIAALIESLAEATVLVTKHGVDAHALVELLTSTLFGTGVQNLRRHHRRRALSSGRVSCAPRAQRYVARARRGPQRQRADAARRSGTRSPNCRHRPGIR